MESYEPGLLPDALKNLQLIDSALNFEPEYPAALGFRCGFLGLQHIDIVQAGQNQEACHAASVSQHESSLG